MDFNYARSPLQDSRLFGPSPWKILALIVKTNGFLSNPAPGENLESGNLGMETGCKHCGDLHDYKHWSSNNSRGYKHWSFRLRVIRASEFQDCEQ